MYLKNLNNFVAIKKFLCYNCNRVVLRKVQIKVDLLIFNNLENDSCIKGIAEKDDIEVMRGIIRFAEEEGITDSSIREYVSSRLANDDNILSRLAQSGKKIGNDLYKLAKRDMVQIYKNLFSVQLKYSPSGNETGFCEEYANSLTKLTAAKDAQELLDLLILHYKKLGSGAFAKYTAFKYDGEFIGIPHIDSVDFDSLIGIEFQKKTLIDNTRAFVNGKRANNVLLFGDRGTGKSSSVKALLSLFAKDGLRLVEIPKHYIKDMPEIVKTLSAKPHKYILFLDDLSFAPEEAEYKSLKIAMEGQLRAHPDNVLVYATSNRRHLVKESWADRQGDEVHKNDQLQETLSLSERFGISLVFSAPNQKEFLNIVADMLKKHDVEIDADIEKQAVVWQMNHGGRNGRCAKQFVAAYISGRQKD